MSTKTVRLSRDDAVINKSRLQRFCGRGIKAHMALEHAGGAGAVSAHEGLGPFEAVGGEMARHCGSGSRHDIAARDGCSRKRSGKAKAAGDLKKSASVHGVKIGRIDSSSNNVT